MLLKLRKSSKPSLKSSTWERRSSSNVHKLTVTTMMKVIMRTASSKVIIFSWEQRSCTRPQSTQTMRTRLAQPSGLKGPKGRKSLGVGNNVGRQVKSSLVPHPSLHLGLLPKTEAGGQNALIWEWRPTWSPNVVAKQQQGFRARRWSPSWSFFPSRNDRLSDPR